MIESSRVPMLNDATSDLPKKDAAKPSAVLISTEKTPSWRVPEKFPPCFVRVPPPMTVVFSSQTSGNLVLLLAIHPKLIDV